MNVLQQTLEVAGYTCNRLQRLSHNSFEDAELPVQVRLRLHDTGSVWNGYKIGTDKPYVYTRPGRSALGRFSYAVSNRFTCESDTVGTVLGVNPTQFR